MSKNYTFKIETNNADIFKNSIIDFAEMLKSEKVDIEAFSTNEEHLKN